MQTATRTPTFVLARATHLQPVRRATVDCPRDGATRDLGRGPDSRGPELLRYYCGYGQHGTHPVDRTCRLEAGDFVSKVQGKAVALVAPDQAPAKRECYGQMSALQLAGSTQVEANLKASVGGLAATALGRGFADFGGTLGKRRRPGKLRFSAHAGFSDRTKRHVHLVVLPPLRPLLEEQLAKQVLAQLGEV